MRLNFSIVTSVYKNDKPEFVRVALDSMLVHQSIKPDEIVLVKDGAVPDYYANGLLYIQSDGGSS